MSLHDKVDMYCERTNFDLLSEPLNLVTNLSFIFAAIYCHKKMESSYGPSRSKAMVLIALLYAIGIGSALFHSFATRWAMAMDVIPIGLFVVCYFMFYFREILNLQNMQVAVSTIVFVSSIVLASPYLPKERLNGSQHYLIICLWLGLLAMISLAKKHRSHYLISTAVLVYLTSIGFRIADLHLCSHFPTGTHFMWHTLNGILLGLLTRFFCINTIKSQSAETRR